MPIEASHMVEHLPAAGLIGAVAVVGPYVRDLILGWWKKNAGEKKIVEAAALAAQLHTIQGILIDAVARLREHSDRDEKSTEEIIHALERYADASQRRDETVQRISENVAQLLGRK